MIRGPRGSALGARRRDARRALAGLGVLLLGACEVGGYGSAHAPDASAGSGRGGASGATGASGSTGGSSGAGASAGSAPAALPEPTAAPNFELRPEYAGPCARAAGAVDVNLGNRPEDFVRAA